MTLLAYSWVSCFPIVAKNRPRRKVNGRWTRETYRAVSILGSGTEWNPPARLLRLLYAPPLWRKWLSIICCVLQETATKYAFHYRRKVPSDERQTSAKSSSRACTQPRSFPQTLGRTHWRHPTPFLSQGSRWRGEIHSDCFIIEIFHPNNPKIWKWALRERPFPAQGFPRAGDCSILLLGALKFPLHVRTT